MVLNLLLLFLSLCCAQSLCCFHLFVTFQAHISWTVPARLLYPWDSPGKNAEVEYTPAIHSKNTFPSPVELSDPEIEPTSPALAGGLFITEPPGKPLIDF